MTSWFKYVGVYWIHRDGTRACRMYMPCLSIGNKGQCCTTSRPILRPSGSLPLLRQCGDHETAHQIQFDVVAIGLDSPPRYCCHWSPAPDGRAKYLMAFHSPHIANSGTRIDGQMETDAEDRCHRSCGLSGKGFVRTVWKLFSLPQPCAPSF